MSSTVDQMSDHSIGGQSSHHSNEVKSNKKENTDYLSLKFSPILFVNEEGLGLKFAMKPCLERRTVRQLIERGGGHMSSANYSPDLINLVTLNSKSNPRLKSNNEFHYLTFVYDSCKANSLLNLSEYLLPKTTTTKKTSECNTQQENDGKQENEVSDPSAEDIPQTEQLNENNEKVDNFHEIDQKILEFIARRKAFADVIGSRIWTKLAEDGIQFAHTWDSTKRRFFDQIMPNIDNYSIEEFDKNKFIEYYNRYKDSESVQNTDSSLSYESIEISDDKEVAEELRNDEKAVNQSEGSNDSESLVIPIKGSNVEENEKNIENPSKDYVSESDVESDQESEESTSKYFKTTNEKFLYQKKPNSVKKSYFNAYLDFMKQRETSNTPENLRRIKQALKVSANEQKMELKNKAKVEKKSFGQKVVSKKTREEAVNTESESQESGYKVSDISSDEIDGKEKSKVISRKVSKQRSQTVSKKMVSQKFKSQYTLSEDELILDFLVKSKRFDELKGNALWEEAEKRDVCEGRSWQSMKERFRKQIMPNIDSYDIPKKDKQRLKICFYSEDLNTSRLKTGSYTYDEDMAILNDIINKSGYELVKGNQFWKVMDKELKRLKLCSRTWQSLKERYLKRIVPNLNNYKISLESAKKILNSVNSLSESEKKLIFNKCRKTSIDSKAKKRTLDVREVQTMDTCDD